MTDKSTEVASLPNEAGEAQAVAEVVWFDPRTSEGFPITRPHKIIDASMAFMDEAAIGTKLYLHPSAAAQPAVREAVLREPTVEAAATAAGYCRFCGAGPREASECEDVRCDIVPRVKP